MKRLFSLFFLTLVLFMTKAASATTWYVRADGGTRYSANASSGQCDGQADAAYPGKGVDQHCAFNDYRFLWDDQHTYGVTKWVIQGGDTVILDNTQDWRVGFAQNGSTADPWCFGGGGTFTCTNPNIPAGTAAQHTRLLGRNYAACSTGNQPDPTKMTQIFGGYGVETALNLSGAQYVDVQCLEITSHSACTIHGSPVYPKDCQRYTSPIDDYDSDGVGTDTNTHDVFLQDLWIHGHTDRGIKGAIGGLVSLNRVDIAVNGEAGWDLDPGDSTQSPNGAIKMSYSTVEWSGCNQIYPDPRPADCYSQSTGGYGDGIGTPVTNMVSVNIDHSIFRYNTQDGEDFGHVQSAGNFTVTNSASYGNNGGQLKWAGFNNVVVENNLIVANCNRMSAPIPGIPSTYNAHLADFCRSGDAISFDFNNNAKGLMANNTIITYAPTTFDFKCYDASSCANTTVNISNNLVLAYDNASTYSLGGQAGGPGGYCGTTCNATSFPIGTINRANNIYYGLRGSCPANQPAFAAGSATGESCLNPQLVGQPVSFTSESVLDGFNFALSSSSPARGAATTIAGLITDYLGKVRTVPTSIGGLEYGSSVTLNNLTSWMTTPVVTAPPSTTPPSTQPPSTTTPPTTSKPPYSTALVLSVSSSNSGAAVLTAMVVPSTQSSSSLRGYVLLYNASNTIIAKGILSAQGTYSWPISSALQAQTVHATYLGNTIYLKSTSGELVVSEAVASLK